MALIMGMRVFAPGGSPEPDASVASSSIGSAMILEFITVSGTSTYDIWSKNIPFPMQVIDFYAYASGGAGGASDTVKLQNGDGADSESFNDITDALDMNVSDNIRVAVATVDDAQHDLQRDESLRIVTASDAVVRGFVVLVPLKQS